MDKILSKYKNGLLPDHLLSPVEGGKLLTEAARAWNLMCLTAQADGVTVELLSETSSYRTIAQQENFFYRRYEKCSKNTPNAVLYNEDYWCLKKGVNLAAVPGTSNHGWGLSVNIKQSPAVHRWLLSNALKFGFCWECNNQPWRLTHFKGM